MNSLNVKNFFVALIVAALFAFAAYFAGTAIAVKKAHADEIDRNSPMCVNIGSPHEGLLLPGHREIAQGKCSSQAVFKADRPAPGVRISGREGLTPKPVMVKIAKFPKISVRERLAPPLEPVAPPAVMTSDRATAGFPERGIH